MDVTQEKRIRDLVEVVDRRLDDHKISLRQYDNARHCLKRMKENKQPCSPENFYIVGAAVWSLVTEKSTNKGRQDNAHAFWHALIAELHLRFPRANTPEQWVDLPRLADSPQKEKWKAFLDRLVYLPTPLVLESAVTLALTPYREHLVEKFREIDLIGFGGSVGQSDPDGGAQLSKVYIDLDTKAKAEPGAEASQTFMDPSQSKSSAIPALQRLAASQRLVLIGLPGSGKSTLLKFFSLCLAQCGLKPDLEWLENLKLWPKEETDLIPVFVELRQFAAKVPTTRQDMEDSSHRNWLERFFSGLGWLPKSLPTVDGGQHLTDYILSQLKLSPLEECSDALKKALVAGRAIVFLDGLDEVPDDDKLRRFVLDTVEAFARGPFKASRIVVTCRPRSYDDPAWQLQGFESAELAALDAAKIERFIDRFYAEVARHDRSMAEVRADRMAKLKLAVRRKDLRDLAGNPFMLTVMAWLHQFKELPKKRALILHLLVEQLLFKWEESKLGDDKAQGQTLPDLLKNHGLEITSLRRVLCRLAFHSLQSSESIRSGEHRDFAVSIPKPKLLAELAGLPSVDKIQKHHRERWALQVLHVIDRRTGLLVPEGEDSFTMPYKLQEFLAGEHLTDRAEVEALGKSLKLSVSQSSFASVVAKLVDENGSWEEVVKWAAAIKAHFKDSKGETCDLASELCDAPGMSNSTSLRRALVAEDIIWELGVNEVANTHPRHGLECLERVRKKLDELMCSEDLTPKQRAAAGAARGRLEDLPAGVGLTKDGVPDVEWIEIRKGKFAMGGKEDWRGGREFHCGLIKAPYRISRYPVTVAQFQAFVDAKGYEMDEFWIWSEKALEWRDGNKRPGQVDADLVFQTPNHPRVGVSWYEAVAFCKWLNKSPKYARNTIQLPSEAEWERAARGAKKRSRTSEGHESDLGQRCNCVQSGIGHTSAVGLFPSGDTPPEIGELGIADLAGNVWEWCRTQWLDNYAQNYDEVISDELAGDNNRVLRGGSWLDDDPRLFSPSYRYFHSPSVRSTRIGFRLVCLGASVGNMLAAKTEKDARGAAWATRLRPQRRKVSEPLAPLPAKAKKRGAGRGR